MLSSFPVLIFLKVFCLKLLICGQCYYRMDRDQRTVYIVLEALAVAQAGGICDPMITC